MFQEVRHYTTQPGRRDEWVTYMDDTVIPFMKQQGMRVEGSFIDEEDPDGYVWIRTFADENQRKSLYEAVYESSTWKNEIGPVVYTLLDRTKTVVYRITPTRGTEE